MKKIIIITLVLTVIILSLITFIRKSIFTQQNFIVSGNVEMDRADISFRIPGIIRDIFFDEGSVIRKDQIIMNIDSDVYRIAAEISEKDLRLAQTRLLELKNGSLPEEINKSDIEVSKNLVNFETMKSEYERSERLFKSNSISESSFEHMKNQFRTAEAMYKQSLLNNELIKKGPREEIITYNRIMVEKLEKILEKELLNLSYTELKAPFDGIISGIYADTGENTVPGKITASVINPDNTWIRTYVPEKILAQVRTGQEVIVRIDSQQKTLKGILSFISEEAEFTPKSVHTPEERSKFVYMVKIRVQNEGNILKNGMPCEVIF